MKGLVKAFGTGAVVIMVMLGAPNFASAQQTCAPRENLLSYLSEKYAEVPHAVGLADNGTVVEVITSKDGATWTLIVTLPNGQSCVMSTGEAWQEIEGVTPKVAPSNFTPAAWIPVEPKQEIGLGWGCKTPGAVLKGLRTYQRQGPQAARAYMLNTKGCKTRQTEVPAIAIRKVSGPFFVGVGPDQTISLFIWEVELENGERWYAAYIYGPQEDMPRGPNGEFDPNA